MKTSAIFLVSLFLFGCNEKIETKNSDQTNEDTPWQMYTFSEDRIDYVYSRYSYLVFGDSLVSQGLNQDDYEIDLHIKTFDGEPHKSEMRGEFIYVGRTEGDDYLLDIVKVHGRGIISPLASLGPFADSDDFSVNAAGNEIFIERADKTTVEKVVFNTSSHGTSVSGTYTYNTNGHSQAHGYLHYNGTHYISFEERQYGGYDMVATTDGTTEAFREESPCWFDEKPRVGNIDGNMLTIQCVIENDNYYSIYEIESDRFTLLEGITKSGGGTSNEMFGAFVLFVD